VKGYDLIVVGLGAAGAATLYQAAKRGARVLGIDRFAPPHDRGSSHGETRITRQGVGEGLEYVPLALRGHEIWREVEAETGESLFRQSGVLMISAPGLGGAHHGKHAFLERTIEAARAFDVPHETLSAAEARARWPQFRIADHEQAYFEPGAGALYPERCVAAQLVLARRQGAEIRVGEPATAVEETPAGVRVTTAAGAYEAAQAVVSAGAWTASLLGGAWSERLTLWRQALHWFDAPDAFAADRFPVFIWMHGAGEGDWFYGFPREAGGVKLATEQFMTMSSGPDAWDRTASREGAMAMHARHAAGRLEGLAPSWRRSAACVYTLAPDSRFIIDRDPAREKVLVVSACSGHGFKHSAAIGEAVTTWALTGERPPVLAPFAL
jgi:sarcosine oxidase